MTKLLPLNILSRQLIFVKNEITFKKPNDLLVKKEKISGILQEIITKSDKKFLITGIGINVIKNPNIKNYLISMFS